MEFIQINDGWNADPNVPMPKIQTDKQNLTLTFHLNSFVFDYKQGDLGILEFRNCRQYRMGAPNEEGFHVYNQSHFKKYGVRWGEFYRIENSDWRTYFPQPVYVDMALESDTLNHYLFYFKDESFECIAESCHFKVIRACE